jgi:hypothetical protein
MKSSKFLVKLQRILYSLLKKFDASIRALRWHERKLRNPTRYHIAAVAWYSTKHTVSFILLDYSAQARGIHTS